MPAPARLGRPAASPWRAGQTDTARGRRDWRQAPPGMQHRRPGACARSEGGGRRGVGGYRRVGGRPGRWWGGDAGDTVGVRGVGHVRCGRAGCGFGGVGRDDQKDPDDHAGHHAAKNRADVGEGASELRLHEGGVLHRCLEPRGRRVDVEVLSDGERLPPVLELVQPSLPYRAELRGTADELCESIVDEQQCHGAKSEHQRKSDDDGHDAGQAKSWEGGRDWGGEEVDEGVE
mmetsp:Transcript_4952/g.16350  ORF Transcript_4952/g.16350 Transcript_4952/m.16350 type:complete len:232 (-) Transcript_4952:201-896(-)